MISAEIVERAWQRVAALPPQRARELSERIAREQPIVTAYLLAIGDAVFDQHEAELILYIGLVVWQIMEQAGRPLRRVTAATIDQAEAANQEFMMTWPPTQRPTLKQRR